MFHVKQPIIVPRACQLNVLMLPLNCLFHVKQKSAIFIHVKHTTILLPLHNRGHRFYQPPPLHIRFSRQLPFVATRVYVLRTPPYLPLRHPPAPSLRALTTYLCHHIFFANFFAEYFLKHDKSYFCNEHYNDAD